MTFREEEKIFKILEIVTNGVGLILLVFEPEGVGVEVIGIEKQGHKNLFPEPNKRGGNDKKGSKSF